ncbi:Wzz/FepE/Etk N-terminal domain-containing protein [Pseudomonas parafulva]|uniref:Wzz/FepE/Etk N-terminal domain-containing protein n=1 Tax=Pseudomonas parafulva TaxID=157782 RepID=UPI0003F9DDE5|nr:Wzz/FepE/Etk N-terminal domain-containing protein [Pseudomonas parafulva]
MNIDSRGAYASASSEIDLAAIFRTLWRRRLLIIAVAGACALVGLALAFIVPPVYEVSTTLRPVELNQLDALNRSKIYTLPPSEALKRVGARLDSYDARLAFFRSRPDLIAAYRDEGQSTEQAFQEFNNTALTLAVADAKKADLLSEFVALKMRYEKTVDGAAVLNDFVDYAVERERLQLSRDMQIILANRLVEVNAKLDSALSEYRAGNEGRIARLEEDDAVKRAQLNDELKALRVQLKLQREARLAELDEAIAIATSLGLKKPSTPSRMAEETAGNGNIINTEVNGRPAPLYFMGTDVLLAERAALRKRTSDDFVEPRIGQIRKELILLSNNRSVEAIKSRGNDQAFLEGIEALRVERARLQAIDTKLQGLSLVSVDQRAVASNKPIKPRKGIWVGVGLIIGLLIGVVAVLMRAAMSNPPRQAQTLHVTATPSPVLPDELGRRNGVLVTDA